MAGPGAAKSSKEKNPNQAADRSAGRPGQAARSGPETEILALQRAAGNQTVRRLVQRAHLRLSRFAGHPRVGVSHPSDKQELEAERVESDLHSQANLIAGSIGEAPGRTPVAASKQNGRRIGLDRGQSIPATDRAFFESHFRTDLGSVRLHRGAAAAELVEALGARAITLGSDIALGSGEYTPGTTAGQQLLAHELAHVAQQQSSPTAVIHRKPREKLSDLSAEERKRIQVITDPILISNLDDLFTTKGGKTTVPLPENVTARFAAAVPQKLHHGLRNVAGTMIQQGELKLHASVTLALNLAKHGGSHAAYRFTYTKYRVSRRKTAQEVVIEQLGSLGKQQLAPAQRKAVQTRKAQHRITFSGSWSSDEQQRLLAALALIPKSSLAQIAGLSVKRESGTNPHDPKEGGHYDPDKHRIHLYDSVFQKSLTRVGDGGTGFRDDSVRAIAHEIGHVLDLRPLYTAFGQAKTITSQKGLRAGKRHLQKARAPSGQRWAMRSGKWEVVSVSAREAKRNAFRKAVRKDGGKAVTQYGATDWKEHFAEAFGLYVTDPERLRALRPNVYDFFVKNYPK
jgi:hypothetical protein